VGLALAGYLRLTGHRVQIWNRSDKRLKPILDSGQVYVTRNSVETRIEVEATKDLERLANSCQVLLVATTANAHAEVIKKLKPFLNGGHRIILVPGRTGGALEVAQILGRHIFQEGLMLGETATSPFACRAEGSKVKILAEKESFSMAALPGRAGAQLNTIIKSYFPRMKLRPNVLNTSLENFGAMLHPVISLVNAAAIQRKEPFFFYHNLSLETAGLIELLDHERLRVASAYGLDLPSIAEWIKTSYAESRGSSLSELMSSCRAFSEIAAPTFLKSRYLLEDVPMGLVPIYHLGVIRGSSMEFTRTIVDFISALLGIDFWSIGRSLANMGLDGMTTEEVNYFVNRGWS
jgi:opine dehydrogenase